MHLKAQTGWKGDKLTIKMIPSMNDYLCKRLDFFVRGNEGGNRVINTDYRRNRKITNVKHSISQS